MPAGPSELAVYADETGVPDYVAADLLSQCEHGTDSQVILVTDSRAFRGRSKPFIETTNGKTATKINCLQIIGKQ